MQTKRKHVVRLIWEDDAQTHNEKLDLPHTINSNKALKQERSRAALLSLALPNKQSNVILSIDELYI
ncbi:hypothetical protein AUR67_07855 [Pseudoalteromonas sp. XI10]|nr:hypothetical protein AUR67_07855 [Pseudoalteromonas sp. XI10]